VVEQVLCVGAANPRPTTLREGLAMGWRARSEPEEYDGGVSMTLWLRETYSAVAPPETELVRSIDAASTPMQAVAVLERPVDVVPTAPAVDPEPPTRAAVLFAERRRERRVDCALAVAAAAMSDSAETALGQAVDISLSGIHVVMDKVAAVGPIDLIVADVVVDARVVGYQKLDDGRHSWHVHVLDPDDEWLEIVRQA
jgi:hypothetical protein